MEDLLLESLFEAVAILDENGKVETINQTFSTLFSVSPRKAKKFDHFWEFIEDKEKSLPNSFAETKKNQTTFLSKELMLDNPKDRSVVIKIIPIDGNKFALCFLDMSVETNLHLKYKSTLSELKSVYAQMVQADKISSLNEITASISHEISNPLTIAMGNAELAISLAKGQPKLEKTIVELQESLERIVVIMDDMRDFLEKNEDKKSYCSWDEIIKNSLKFIQKSFDDKNVKLSIVSKKSGLVGYLNQTKLEQVLINLLTNALHAIVESKHQDGEAKVVLDYDQEMGMVHLSVEDNGTGISEEIQEEIFKPFFTTKEEGMGSGLGLSISEKIISSMNGTIHMESDGQSGTTFHIYIPSVEISSYIEGTVQQHSNHDKSATNLLIIHQNPDVLNKIDAIFEGNEDFNIIGSSNLNDAIHFLEKANVQLIILDQNIPSENKNLINEKLKSLEYTSPLLFIGKDLNLEEMSPEKIVETINKSLATSSQHG